MVRLGAVTHTTPDTDAALIGRSWQEPERFAALVTEFLRERDGRVLAVSGAGR